MDSFNKENIIISQDDISTPLKTKNSISNISPLRDKSRSYMNHSIYRNNTPNQKEAFILQDDALLLKDYQELEKQYANLMIQNDSITLEVQNLEMELLLKEKELLHKSSKINELVIENRQLDKSLKAEIRDSEQNYSNWTKLKLQYESKIANLNARLNGERSFLSSLKSHDVGSNEQVTIQLLNKKLKSLQSDYELEKNSKMLIIDEFEMIKQNYLNLELSYNLLKNDFDKLHDETSSGSIISEKHQQDLSFQSDSSYGDDDVEHIYSNDERNNRHLKVTTLADELTENGDKYHYNQELIKLNFQIKSLNLQNEKLYSYIGYLLQQSSMNSDKEYSDEKLIKIAKKKLVNNKILRSVSSSLRLHQSNGSDHPQLLMVYSDHATEEEMSIFLNDCYDKKNKKVYNIKSTANLKKLHFTNHLYEQPIIHEELDTRTQLSILKDLIVGSKINCKKLNLSKFLLSGIVEFLDENGIDYDEHLITYDID